VRFVAECGLWLIAAAAAASPLLITRVRERLMASIPR
jgi:hypothetical protein